MRNKESFICLLFSVFFIVVLFLSGCKDDDANRPLSEIVYQTVWEVTETGYNLDNGNFYEDSYIVEFLTDSTGTLVRDHSADDFMYFIDGRVMEFNSYTYMIVEQTNNRFVLQLHYSSSEGKWRNILTFNKMY